MKKALSTGKSKFDKGGRRAASSAASNSRKADIHAKAKPVAIAAATAHYEVVSGDVGNIIVGTTMELTWGYY